MTMQTGENIKNQLKEKKGNNNQDSGKENNHNTITKLIQRMEPEIKRALPQHLTPERMARITLTAIRNTPLLGEADHMSLLGAVMQSAQLGLEPNTPLGEAYLIPYRNNKKGIVEAQFQMGYRGILSLAHRTGQYKAIYAHEVYSNDRFSFQYGLHKDIVHVPADNPEGDAVYFYAVYHLKNGGYDFVVWSRDKMQLHMKQYSKSASYSSSPWQSDFNAMAKKTVLKDVLKYAPKSIEFSKALSADETIKTDLSEDMSEVIDMTDYEERNRQVVEGQQEGQNQNQ